MTDLCYGSPRRKQIVAYAVVAADPEFPIRTALPVRTIP